MQWDNSPVHRRRRRLVAAGVVVCLLGITSCTVALFDHDAPAARPSPHAVTTSGPAIRERSGRAPAVTLAFAGDSHAFGPAARINDVGLGETGKVLAAADLAMVNLETAVAADRQGLVPEPKRYTFATGPRILDSLSAAGVDVVTVANNHAMDFGRAGLERMLQVKAASPVPMVGIGSDDVEAWAPWSTWVKGRKVVVFAATDVLEDHLDWAAGPGKPGLAKTKDDQGATRRLVDGVRAARQAGQDDVVVVYLHSGVELTRCPTARQQDLAAQLSAAGADVVVNSHAHILQATSTVGQTAVAYGLGNFVFDGRSAQTRATGVWTVTVPGTSGAPTASFAPARIDRGLPTLLAGAEREAALASFAGLGQGCP